MGFRIFSSVNRGWLERLSLSGCTTYVQTYSPCRCYLCWVIRCYQRYVSTTWIHLNLCQYCISVISTKSPLFEVESKSWLNWIWFLSLPETVPNRFWYTKNHLVPRSFHGHLCPGHLFFTHRHGNLGLGLHRVPGGRCRGGRTSCGGSALSGHGWRQRQAGTKGEGWEGRQAEWMGIFLVHKHELSFWVWMSHCCVWVWIWCFFFNGMCAMCLLEG